MKIKLFFIKLFKNMTRHCVIVDCLHGNHDFESPEESIYSVCKICSLPKEDERRNLFLRINHMEKRIEGQSQIWQLMSAEIKEIKAKIKKIEKQDE